MDALLPFLPILGTIGGVICTLVGYIALQHKQTITMLMDQNEAKDARIADLERERREERATMVATLGTLVTGLGATADIIKHIDTTVGIMVGVRYPAPSTADSAGVQREATHGR